MRWWHDYFPFPTAGTEKIRAATSKYAAFSTVANIDNALVWNCGFPELFYSYIAETNSHNSPFINIFEPDFSLRKTTDQIDAARVVHPDRKRSGCSGSDRLNK